MERTCIVLSLALAPSLAPPSVTLSLISPSLQGRKASEFLRNVDFLPLSLGERWQGSWPFFCIPGAYQLTKLAWDNCASPSSSHCNLFSCSPFLFPSSGLIGDRNFIRGGRTSITLQSYHGLWQNVSFNSCPPSPQSLANSFLGTSVIHKSTATEKFVFDKHLAFLTLSHSYSFLSEDESRTTNTKHVCMLNLVKPEAELQLSQSF